MENNSFSFYELCDDLAEKIASMESMKVKKAHYLKSKKDTMCIIRSVTGNSQDVSILLDFFINDYKKAYSIEYKGHDSLHATFNGTYQGKFLTFTVQKEPVVINDEKTPLAIYTIFVILTDFADERDFQNYVKKFCQD